jgi:hypothetical protein
MGAGLLASDASAVAEHLSGALRSFAVVPITPMVGLLAFVPNTQPLYDSMLHSGAAGKLTPKMVKNAGDQYVKTITSKLGAVPPDYSKVFLVLALPSRPPNLRINRNPVYWIVMTTD